MNSSDRSSQYYIVFSLFFSTSDIVTLVEKKILFYNNTASAWLWSFNSCRGTLLYLELELNS